MRRFALLYTGAASYTRACVQALVDKYDTEVIAVDYAPSPHAPYPRSPLDGIGACLYRDDFTNPHELADRIAEFYPDVVYVSGWSDKLYLKAARLLREKGFLVVSGLDGQYHGSLKQRLAIVASPIYLKSAFDVMWVSGERQRYFAQRLGYIGNRCWEGLYCCDWERFHGAEGASRQRKKEFLYVGRYVDVKALDVLLAAYKIYRERVSKPWSLKCVGKGPLASLLAGQAGVFDAGFTQPEELPGILHESGAFVLPSRSEPWGVVVQEAAAAGLPIISSDSVGAAVHLVRHLYNGYMFPVGDVDFLAECLVAISTLTDAERSAMGERSSSLSRQYLPERWADTLVSGLKSLSS